MAEIFSYLPDGSRKLALIVVLAASSNCFGQSPVPAQVQPAVSPQTGNAVPVPRQIPKGAVPGVLPPGALPPGMKGGLPTKPATKKPKAPAKPKVIRRPDKPAKPADPTELKARPNSDGLLQFSFQGQPWPGIMEWLAEVSGMSLNWKELPGDYLNLTTQRPYSLAETRDLINSHLIDSGFTMLIENQSMRVIKIKDLDISAIPRVTPDQLADRQPHEFVRVSFQLDWLVAESAVQELKPMLSRNGKLHQLATTNRVEAIDTVANLRAIDQLLREEQSQLGQQRLIRPFVLKHRRAVDVIDLVKELIGLKSEANASAKPPTNPQQAQMMQMMQAQAGGAKKKTPKSAEPEVHLVLNQRENSILAHAPPNKMAEIEQAIRALDVPNDSANALFMNPERMQVYRLTSFEPKPFVDLLNELGDLDPRTQLKIDEENNAVIAYASLADHMAIKLMMERLDGSVRKFEVIKLRRLEAAYVAGTIKFMMTNDEKEDSSSRSRFFGFSPFGMSNSKPKRNSDKFKVDADVENNRLLLWANKVELEEIGNLLRKLGEDPDSTGREDQIRVFEVNSGQTAEQLLDQVRRMWHRDNPIETAPASSDSKTQDAPSPDNRINTTDRKPTQQMALTALRANQTTQQEQPATGTKGLPSRRDPAIEKFFKELNETPKTKTDQSDIAKGETAPVRLSIRPDGKIVVASADADALAAMEQLLAKLAPPRRDYNVFRLKHIAPLDLTLTLEEFFEQPDKDGNGIEYDPFFGFMPSRGKADNSDVRLSRRRIPRFIPDGYTSTILVQGADRSQLETIEQLIKIYDQPEASDSRSLRMTKIFPIKHSRAMIISTAIKDVFRDLLSSNDKALGKKKEDGKPADNFYTYLAGAQEEDAESPVKFEGLLSIGVDEYSNTLIVSSTAGLLETIGQIIENLDQAAAPQQKGYKVVPLSSKINPALLQKRLQTLFGDQKKKTTAKPKPSPTTQSAQPAVPGQ
jgi:type II secretory pathway component GspD/PulD (secretin)